MFFVQKARRAKKKAKKAKTARKKTPSRA